MTRNYKSEYKNYHSKPKQKKDRAARNAANRMKGVKGRDVDHKDGNPRNNKPSNLRAVSKSKNRSFPRTKTARKKK